MWDFKLNRMAKKNWFIGIVVAYLLLFNVSCKKEKTYVYDVKDVTVTGDGSAKENVKTTTEFISIAYSDIFGTTIPNPELVKLSTAYSDFGDKKLVEEMIIKNFLNMPSANVPTKAFMQANVNLFVKNTYKKFFNREPNEFELWSLTNTINTDTNITPELIYFGAMTSNEYRYY